MTAHERLRQAIDERAAHLAGSVPPGAEAAVLALLGTLAALAALDDQRQQSDFKPAPDLVTGSRRPGLGAARALQLCLESVDADATLDSGGPGRAPDGWAERFLEACGQLVEAELVLTHCQTGFMRIADDENGAFAAWIATKRAPASWRERADVDWWAAALDRRHEFDLRDLLTQRSDPDSDDPDSAEHDRRIADACLATMAHQLPYPAGATIGGLAIEIWREILGWLINRALRERDRGGTYPSWSRQSVVEEISTSLNLDSDVISDAIGAFTLDRDNAAWHAALPGAAPPLVRIGPDWLMPWIYGLTTEPLFFLTRELRRRDAEAYHNTAHLREVAFRQDLYAVFQDKRFVTSPGRIELRRDSGNIRTDIDAAIFDRKTGTLGVFELKSPDPFARSAAELMRQRDNVLYANRQVSGVLDWIRRHGADAILERIDRRTARMFRAQKVYPFVLGRYLVHFNDGPEPDRRAAWATWPQVLRLLGEQPFPAAGGNPLASLHARISKDTPIIEPPTTAPSREIDLGAARLIVHPSYAAYRASEAVGGSRLRQPT